MCTPLTPCSMRTPSASGAARSAWFGTVADSAGRLDLLLTCSATPLQHAAGAAATVVWVERNCCHRTCADAFALPCFQRRLGDVVSLVCEMAEGGIKPDAFTFTAILNACQRADEAELALDVAR